MSTAATTLKHLTKKTSAATTDVMAEIARLRQEIRTVQHQRERAARAPLPLNEIAARIPLVVEAEGVRWLAKNGYALRAQSPAVALMGVGADGRVRLPDMSDAWGWLCAGAPDTAIGVLQTLVGQVEYDPGAPAAERPALLAAAEQELRQLEEAEEQIIIAAAVAGVTIARRPEVVRRQEREARLQELNAEKVAQREERQAALDAEHGEYVARTSRSSYLTQSTRSREAGPY